MTDIREIIRQLRDGRSCRAVGRSLKIDHTTVSVYRKWAEAKGWLEDRKVLPEAAALEQSLIEWRGAAPAQNISSVNRWHAVIAEMVEQQMEAVVIHQRLSAPPHHFSGGYAAVYRYIRKHFRPVLEACIRIETQPGEEGQVDFGFAGLMWDPVSKRLRRGWVFVMTLSWSRHQFLAHVFEQTIDVWLECHRQAFEYFGGVPGRIVLDNLKAGIAQSCFDDPVITRAYREFGEHYSFSVEPCHVRSPQEKGKVENGVHYYKRNFLAGRAYTNAALDIHAANRDVMVWVETIAGVRIHGTTRKQPLPRFLSSEQSTLRPLPATPYERVAWKRVKLHRDCHVTFDNAYYSAPASLIGEILWVRANAQRVELWHNNTRVALHTRATEAGIRTSEREHLPEHKRAAFDALHGCGVPHAVSLKRAAAVGPFTRYCVELMLDNPAQDRRRTVERLIGLADKHSKNILERACKVALQRGDPSSTTIRTLIKLALTGSLPDEDLPASRQALPAPRYTRSAEELVPAADIWPTPA